MVAVDPDRISSIGYWNFARTYYRAAQRVKCGRPLPFDAPMLHLLEHTIELALKAYLLSRGCSPQDLQSLSHNLRKLLAAADQKGIADYWVPTPEFEAAIEIFGELGCGQRLRYFERGFQRRVDPEVIFLVVRDLLRSIKEPCVQPASGRAVAGS